MNIWRPLLCLTAAAWLGGCATAEMSVPAGVRALPKLSPAEQRGHAFAVRRCSGCHTVGLDDGGAQEGPSFRSLALRYNPISLERRFAEVSEHGMDRMPPVAFSRAEAEDLIAYFGSLGGL